MAAYNPYASMLQFGGSGFEQTDPYSQFQNGALPSTGYVGAPMDAMGNPIASYQAPQPQAAAAASPGMTLNSNPGGSAAFLQQALGMTPSQQTAGGKVNADQMLDLIFPGMSKQMNTPSSLTALGINPWGGQQSGGQAASGASSPAFGAQNYQAALTALANPNRVSTPGVAVPSGPSYQPSSGVLPAMMQQWQRQPGNTLNTNFVNALGRLQQGQGRA